ncbi:lanthionine synthetase C family protein [Streptomyces sp. NBC_00237]|uniref:lanthionine synthetase C family protein n=1 Tax=Streptomyces sp. NBC_00237 TaxID=2975687 RepID=UPI002256772C|nr:lanthionine synthetase C family protein [Streptomyces sp. NBC_00237]MCX5206026.1 lanthionine synthetase C family protein [Streptomyces sp. NBC_00237]
MTHPHPHDLGRGLAGTMLLHGITARTPNDRAQLRATAKALAHTPVSTADASLYQDLPAVAYALSTCADSIFEAAVRKADPQIAVLAKERLAAAHRRIDEGSTPPRTWEYDLISGLSGYGAYFLHRQQDPETLHDVLRYLVRLLEVPVTVAGRPLPGWWSANPPDSRESEGRANLGLAHGVAGPVALLALAARAGHTVPGQKEALQYACHLLAGWRVAPPDSDAPGWPETLTLAEWRAGKPSATVPGRPSWCYGTPGIARALQLAALAVRSPDHQQLAETTFWACLNDDRQIDRLTDLTVCHGWAGLLLTADRIAADAADHPKARLAELKESFAFGARERASPPTPGLLTGDDGIQLAQRTLDVCDPVDPGWQTCLLLT